MAADDILRGMQIAQSFFTTLSIIVGGGWVFTTFILGRSFAPNVHLSCEVEQIVHTSEHQRIILEIKAKNIGKTRLKHERCYVILIPLDNIRVTETPEMSAQRVDLSIQAVSQENTTIFFAFEGQKYLEPNEEITEQMLLQFSKSKTIQAVIYFYGRRRRISITPPYSEDWEWTHSMIVNMHSTESQ